MAYTPQTINPGDDFAVEWANKIEQEIARRGSFMGIVNTEADLPDTPEIGDWYIVLDKGQIYLWNGSKWLKVGGGGMNYVQDSLRIDLAETYLGITNETPSGTVDGVNTAFTVLNPPVQPGTLSITVDESSTITDNGDGTLSDGGTVNYDTGEFTLAAAPTSSIAVDYHQAVWDPIKFAYIALDGDYPQNVEIIADFVVNGGVVKVRGVIYDADDTELLAPVPVELSADGSRQTVKFVFDVSSLSAPNVIAAQLEVMCDPNASGYHDVVEVRWY